MASSSTLAAAAASSSSPSNPVFRKLNTAYPILYFEPDSKLLVNDASAAQPGSDVNAGARSYPVKIQDPISGTVKCPVMFTRFAIASDDQSDKQPNWCIEFIGLLSKFKSCTSKLVSGDSQRTTLFLSELPDLVQCYPALSLLYRASAPSLPSIWCSKCGFAEYPSHFCDQPGCSIALCRSCRQRFLPLSNKEYEANEQSARYYYFPHNQHQHSPIQSSLRSSFNAIPTALIVCYTMSQEDLADFFDIGLTSAGLAQWGMGLYVFSIWVESTAVTEAKIKGLLPIIKELHISQAIVVWFGHHDPLKRVLVYESSNKGVTGSDSWPSIGKALAPVFRALYPRVVDGQRHDQTSAHRQPLDDIGLIVMTCEAHSTDAASMLQAINQDDPAKSDAASMLDAINQDNTIVLRDIVSFLTPLNIDDGKNLLSTALKWYTNRSQGLTKFKDAHNRRHVTWVEALQISMSPVFVHQAGPFIVSASLSNPPNSSQALPSSSPPSVTYSAHLMALLDIGQLNQRCILRDTSVSSKLDPIPGLLLTPAQWQAEVDKENIFSPSKRKFHSLLECGEHHLRLAQTHGANGAAANILKVLQPVYEKQKLYPPPSVQQPASASSSAPKKSRRRL